VAGSVGSLADKVAGEAGRKLDTQAESLERAAAEARALAKPFDLDGDSVAEVQAAIEERFIEERTRVETIGTRITSLKERLVRRGELEASVAANQKRGRTMRTLAQALHSDRLVAFVQGEALERLAIAASEHLRDLSGGRYRLGCNDDDFEVVDTWNGDERRNVRTLSGGETFLASLSLALALAEQLSALAVGGHARLDSLFLDEGFGSLDPETLEVVTAAVETLREGGRLVGIITHIAELAERMPVRFVIAKSPRGSRVRREGPVGVEVNASAAAS
jgi:exonuclease SbcC